MGDDLAKLHALFNEALEQPAAERPEWVDRQCALHPELAAELRTMLSADAAVGGILDAPVSALASGMGLLRSGRQRDRAGERIGPFVLMTALGRGGMGEVYRADRVGGDFEQTVALKVMRVEQVDMGAQARFLLERRILARLTHPNIAHFVDGGFGENDEPWFAMEYVSGEPLLDWCNARQLTIEERLRLLLDVCGAVESAHRHLVIHRDIKPGNVLVDADGRVKLLDFGIAKLLEDDGVADQSTGTQARLLTPEYATPEQVRGDPVTTATDIHALALLMYELLCGRRAFGSRSSSPFDVQREVLENEPPAMSLALQSDSAGSITGDSVAQQRGVDAATLAKRLHGDLQHIVSKALRKEPEQRYRSVAAFADDIRRYLASEPVAAAGGARSYRVRKFLRRHRFGVVAGAAIVVILLGGVIATMLQAHRANVEAERAEAQTRSAVATKNFLIAAFKSASPNQALGQSLTPRQMIDEGARRARLELSKEPSVQVEFFDAIGDIYVELGDKTTAEKIYREALATAQSSLGDTALLTDVTRVDLATALVGRETADDARASEARDILQMVIDRASDETQRKQLRVKALYVLGALQDQLNKTSEGQLSLASAVNAARELGASHEDLLADALVEWGGTEERSKHCPDAIPHFREALEIRLRLLDHRSPEVATVQHELALCLDDEGHAEEAEQLLRAVESSQRQTLGESHPEYANTLNSLATILIDTGKMAEAETLLQKALRIYEEHVDPSGDSVAEVLNSLSVLKSYEFDYRTATDLEARALVIWQQRHGPTYDYALVAMLNLAMYRNQLGDMKGAEGDFLKLRDIRAKAGLPADPSVSLYLSTTRRYAGSLSEAKSWAEESIALAKAANGETSVEALQGHEELAIDERDLHDWVAARKEAQFALNNFIASGGAEQPNVTRLRFLLAQVDYEESHCDRAAPVFEDSIKRFASRTDRAGVQMDNAAKLFAGLCKRVMNDMSAPSAASLIDEGKSKLLANGPLDPYFAELVGKAKAH
jgi:eukaryotic-like serine/threonine-protein kinase